jgi:hypothetical protein
MWFDSSVEEAKKEIYTGCNDWRGLQKISRFCSYFVHLVLFSLVETWNNGK